MTLPPLRTALVALVALAALAAAAPSVRAQDTTPPRGVHIGLAYDAGVKPGVVVGLVRGATGDSVRAIVMRDFDAGDRIEVIGAPGTSGADAVAQIGAGVNYKVWKALGAAAAAQMTLTAGGVHVAVYDVAKQSLLQTRDFPLPAPALAADWRLAVHGVSDEVERWITGTKGVAATRVLFVRGGRIHVIDSDGWGERAVSEPGLALSPAWHPGGHLIAYSASHDRGWRIMLRDLAGGTARALGTTPQGLNITPVFSPDGGTLVYAHGDEDGTDLYAVAMTGLTPGASARRVTVGHGADNVSPSFSPDGGRIAFTSGRLGHPEVYVADADGANAEMLTPFAYGDEIYRSNPDWSPDGRQVAYQAQISGVFQLMAITLRDRSVRQLTSEGRNEDASWAPDGRHLVFASTRTGAMELFVLDAESGRARQLTHGGGSRLPAWSPALTVAP